MKFLNGLIIVCLLMTVSHAFADQEYQDEYEGVIRGIVKECDTFGNSIDDVSIYINGTNEIVGTTNDGIFELFLPGGNYDLEFRHEYYITKTLHDVIANYHSSSQSEIPVEVYLTYPDAYVSPMALDMFIQQWWETPTTEEFSVQNNGCGPLEFTTDVFLLEDNADRTAFPLCELDQIGDILGEYSNLDSLTSHHDNSTLAMVSDYLYVGSKENPFITSISSDLTEIENIDIPDSISGNEWPGFISLSNDNNGYLYGANDSGKIYKFLPDMSEINLIGQYDISIKSICYFWQINWLMVLDSDSNFYKIIYNGEISELNNPERNIAAICYDPKGAGGYKLYGLTYSLPSVVISYNPWVDEWNDTPIDTVYGIDSRGMPGGFASGIREHRVVFASLLENTDVDKVTFWEGNFFIDWFSISPDAGVIEPGEEMDVEITVDVRDSDYEPESCDTDMLLITFSNELLDDFVVLINIEWYTPYVDLESIDQKSVFLLQNVPNPFNPSTTIQFDLQKQQNVTLTVFNLMGQEVDRLLDSSLDAGHHAINFDGSHLASGIYFYRIETSEFSEMKKMVIMK